jgi:hypothetical protein
LNKGIDMIYNTGDMLGQFALALTELIDSGAWDRDEKLEVKIAGTLKNDKFIVIKPVKERLICNANPKLKQHHDPSPSSNI